MGLSEEDFDQLVSQLQANTFAEAREAYGEKGFARWRKPRFNIALAHADAQARVIGSCGDMIEIQLEIRNGRVWQAAYATNGCASSALCGSFAAELAHGCSFEELGQITPDDVLKAIGRFPKEERHCAKLAVKALQKALDNYLQNRESNFD